MTNAMNTVLNDRMIETAYVFMKLGRSVEYFALDTGLNIGDARELYELAKLNPPKKESASIGICKVCGKQFLRGNRRKKYCGQKCAKKAAETEETTETKQKPTAICRWCKKEFVQEKGRAYCSPECRHKSERLQCSRAYERRAKRGKQADSNFYNSEKGESI